MSYPCFVVDAFTASPFSGNPAADTLTDAQMQAVAAEFNLSETTFILRPTEPGAQVRFRWFTPTTEVNMCGHASIAAIHVMHETGRWDEYSGHQPAGAGADGTTQILIETSSGVLNGFYELPATGGGLTTIWLELPKPRITPCQLPLATLGDVLGGEAITWDDSLPPVRTQDDDVLVFVRDFVVLAGLKPDFVRLRRFQDQVGTRGLCVATTRTVTHSISVQSRFFAPAAGINEDPVTGSVHGPLAAYLVHNGRVPVRDQVAGLQCTQTAGSGRTGLVWALVHVAGPGQYAVRIGGHAATTIRGELSA